MITTKQEQYLEVLLDIVELLPDYDKEYYNDAVSKKLNKDDVYEMGIGGRCGYLVNEIRAEIYDYETKHSGGGKMLSFAKKILRRSQRMANKTFHYATQTEGFTYFSDGVMAVKTSQELKSLEAPEELRGKIGEFDFCGTISKLSFEIEQRLTLPNLCKLKTLYRLEKVKFKTEKHFRGASIFRFFYDFGENLPSVDGEKLIEIMDAIPDIELYTSKHGNLYGKSANGSEEVLLCPIRKVDSNGKPTNCGYTFEDVENVIA